MARVVLEVDTEPEFAQRNPAALATPAYVDQLLPIGQQFQERGNGLRRIGVGIGEKGVAGGGDAESGHDVIAVMGAVGAIRFTDEDRGAVWHQLSSGDRRHQCFGHGNQAAVAPHGANQGYSQWRAVAPG